MPLTSEKELLCSFALALSPLPIAFTNLGGRKCRDRDAGKTYRGQVHFSCRGLVHWEWGVRRRGAGLAGVLKISTKRHSSDIEATGEEYKIR